MTTRTTPIQPLEVAGIRDHVREPRRVRGIAVVVAPLAALTSAIAVYAAVLDSRAPIGPGRVLCASLVVVWCLSALFVASRRSDEPLALVMVGAAFAAALAMTGSALLGRDRSSISV